MLWVSFVKEEEGSSSVVGREGRIYDSLIHIILNISFYLSYQQKFVFPLCPQRFKAAGTVVDQIAGKRKRSLLIAEATREKLQRERFLRTFEETRGAWSDKNHPGLKTERDMVGNKRKGYRKRLKGSFTAIIEKT